MLLYITVCMYQCMTPVQMLAIYRQSDPACRCELQCGDVQQISL